MAKAARCQSPRNKVLGKELIAALAQIEIAVEQLEGITDTLLYAELNEEGNKVAVLAPNNHCPYCNGMPDDDDGVGGVQLTAKEWEELVEEQCQRTLGISRETFVEQYLAGKLDIEEVMHILMLLPELCEVTD